MHDVGLLGAMSATTPPMLLDGNALFTNFKGALAEQFVLQELVSEGIAPNYWTSDSGNAEVEFVIQGATAVFPVEAKAGVNTKAKSLKIFRELFKPPYAIRTSLQPHHDAATLGIREDRVKVHINTIFSKLGAANRTEAVAIALRKFLTNFQKIYGDAKSSHPELKR